MNPFYENDQIPLRAFSSRNTGFPLHLHAQLELFYVREGEVEITAGPHTFLAGPGDLGVIFPHVVHSYATPADSFALAAMVGLEAAGGYYQTLTQFRPDRPVLPAELVHPDLVYCLQSLERELTAPAGIRSSGAAASFGGNGSAAVRKVQSAGDADSTGAAGSASDVDFNGAVDSAGAVGSASDAGFTSAVDSTGAAGSASDADFNGGTNDTGVVRGAGTDGSRRGIGIPNGGQDPGGSQGGEAAGGRDGRPNGDACRAMVQLILARLMPCLVLSPNPSGEREELTYQIIRYLAGHYREPVTLTQLAEALRVNRYHLSHVFGEKFGMSFTCYLNNLRLELATHLLRTSRMPVTQICAEAGFASPRTFNRVFRENYGLSPLQYRRTGGGENPF